MSLLDEIRFRQDNPELFHVRSNSEDVLRANVDKQFSLRHVKITRGLFPTLQDTIDRAFKALGLNNDYQAYVSADETLNASCIASKEGAIIWISSGLVKTLEEDELGFVLGHEIGHWYLKHHLYERREDINSQDFKLTQSLSRACEISADRFGLLAVGDIDIALRAIVKTASGLTDEYFGDSLGDYLRQIQDIKNLAENIGEVYSSHPPMITRARALLWFSMSRPYSKFVNGVNSGDSMETVDNRVESDLNAALGFEYVASREDDLKHQVFWTLVDRLGADGGLDKSDQKMITDCFGEKYLSKLIGMISGLSKARVQSELQARARQAETAIRSYSKAEVRKFLKSSQPIEAALKSHKISLT